MPPGEPYELETGRFSLRPLLPRHVGRLAEILSDPDVVKTLAGDVSTPERTRAYAAGWVVDDAFWRSHGFGFWGVFDRRDLFALPDPLIGVIGADDPPPLVGEGPEIYYFFAKEVWRNGVAGDAVRAMCDHLFAVVGVPALEATVFAERNPASVRVLESAGMRFVGRLPLIGHHLSLERARTVIEFDIWRVRNAAPERKQVAVQDAAFRIGQLLAEVASSRDHVIPALLAAAGDAGLQEAIDTRLADGMKAKGLAHYRVRRDEYRSRRL